MSEFKIKEDPNLFEYDEKNRIVDIFVKKDPDCPHPFTNGEWWHQGFYLEEFAIILDIFFQKNRLPYSIIEK